MEGLMALNQFKSWKLLYEDHDLCFSKAVNKDDASNVFFITFFDPDKMSVATKHLLEDHLHNYMSLVEEDGKLHLILKAHEGRAIQKFIKHSKLDYDDRVQIVYEYFKLIEKYDAFPNPIKVQLLDEEQLLISDDGLAFRELIDYAPTQVYSNKDVFKQLGKTLDLILQDAEGYHSQFIDNLILGNHSYDSLKAAKNHFKDVFIFEKPDALESISYEYTIVLNDLEAGPPIKVTKEVPKIKDQVLVQPNSSIEINDLHHDELRLELADLLANTHNHPEKEFEPVPENEIITDTEVNTVLETPVGVAIDDYIDNESVSVEDVNARIDEKLTAESDSIKHDEADFNNSDKVQIKMDAKASIIAEIEADLLHTAIPTIPNVSKDTKSFKAIFQEDDQMPDSLPKSSKQRFLEEDDALFVDDVSEMFDDDVTGDLPPRHRFQIKWVLIGVVILLILALGIWAIKSMFNSKPVAAQFEIEPLHDNRIAFMNTSSGGKQIKAYSWEIYYADTLVQKFDDENLFPVFDTEGTYKIVMKVQDKKGDWSEPFTQEYAFEQTLQPTDTTETP
jgi:hypothetical protein